MPYGVTQKKAPVKVQSTPEQIAAQEKALIAWCEEQIADDKQKLLAKFPFTGNFICRLDVEVGHWPDVPTACTNGDKIWVNVLFYVKLDPEERLFVLAHECWHVILRHFLRKTDRNPELWNCAIDLEVHFLLTKEGFKAPFVLPHDPRWCNLSAEEIYEKLLKKIKQEQAKADKGEGQCGKKGDDNEGDGGQSKNPMGDIPEDWNKGKGTKNLQGAEQGKGFDRHDKREDPNGEEDNDDPKEVEERVCDKIKVAATFAKQRTRGLLPSHLESLLDNLPKPEIPWQQVLRQFLTQTMGGNRRWLPPNRRYVWKGLYVQSTKQMQFKGVVAMDTSGSCLGDLPKFFSELTGLLNSFGKYDLTVLQCDAAIEKVERFSDEVLPPNNKEWRMHGGGGTSHKPVFNWIKDNCQETPNCLICLTDGYTDVPNNPPPYPVLWVLTEDGQDLPWGINLRLKGGNNQ